MRNLFLLLILGLLTGCNSQGLPKTLVYQPVNTLTLQYNWPDRRPIGALHVAGEQFRSPDNPAAWHPYFLSGQYADSAITVLKAMNAQGMILWDGDGRRFGIQSYLGSPDLAQKINPEINLRPFFQKFIDAGFKVGILVRASEFNLATGQHEDSKDHYKTLERKVKFARETWKCKLFYVDTNEWGAWGGGLLPAAIFARLHKAFPDCLFIPEHGDATYALWCPEYRELRMGETVTPSFITQHVPAAFSVFNLSGASVEMTQQMDFKSLIQRGEILMANGWHFSPEVDIIIKAYK